MKPLISHISALLAGLSLIFTPIAAQANTRAADSPSYVGESEDDDDDGGILLRHDGSFEEDDDDDEGWLFVLFGAAATIGAIIIILSGQSDSGGPSGPNQSNGAN